MGSRRCRNPTRVAPPAPACRKGGVERRPIDTLGRRWARRFVGEFAKRVRGDRAKSRTRSSPEYPRRAKPKGVSGAWRTKPPTGHKGLSRGSNPGNRGLLGRPNATAAGAPIGETVGGAIRVVIARIPFERRTLRRVNPMSAAGVKQNRRGIEGSKPSRG